MEHKFVWAENNPHIMELGFVWDYDAKQRQFRYLVVGFEDYEL